MSALHPRMRKTLKLFACLKMSVLCQLFCFTNLETFLAGWKDLMFQMWKISVRGSQTSLAWGRSNLSVILWMVTRVGIKQAEYPLRKLLMTIWENLSTERQWWCLWKVGTIHTVWRYNEKATLAINTCESKCHLIWNLSFLSTNRVKTLIEEFLIFKRKV